MRITSPGMKAATEQRFVAAAGGGSLGFARRGGDNSASDSGTQEELVTWPSGVTSDDLAVVVVQWFENGLDATVNTPTGFTQRTPAGGAVITGSGSNEERVSIFTKECAGTETGDLSVTFVDAAGRAVTLDVFQGDGDLTFTSLSSMDTGSSSDATAPSVTGTEGQGLLAIYALTDQPGTINSGPSGMTAGSLANSPTVTGTSAVYYQDLTSSGATGTKTWDFTTTVNWGGHAMLITITP